MRSTCKDTENKQNVRYIYNITFRSEAYNFIILFLRSSPSFLILLCISRIACRYAAVLNYGFS